MGPGLDELAAGDDGVNESRTRRRQVESPRSPGADAVLDQAGGGGEHHIGSDRGHDDEVYIRGVHIPLAQEALADCCGHERGGLAVQYPTLPDAGALPDPGVGGVDYLL